MTRKLTGAGGRRDSTGRDTLLLVRTAGIFGREVLAGATVTAGRRAGVRLGVLRGVLAAMAGLRVRTLTL